MMPAVSLLLGAVLACGALTCPYHNDDFNYSVEFPKIKNTTVCVPDDPGGRHGAALEFAAGTDCTNSKVPWIWVNAEYNALYWKSSIIAARELCPKGVVRRTRLKLEGFPVSVCDEKDEHLEGWRVVSYITITGHKEDGLILSVGLVSPPDDVEKYRPIAFQVLKAFRLDSSGR